MRAETVPSRNAGTSRSRETARKVLETEAGAVAAFIPRLDHRFDQAIELLGSCTGRMVLTGMENHLVAGAGRRRKACGDHSHPRPLANRDVLIRNRFMLIRPGRAASRPV